MRKHDIGDFRADITVCICTYKRVDLLNRLLMAIAEQRTDGKFTFLCAVVDNDAEHSALPVVEQARTHCPVQIEYASERTRNFAVIRNTAVGMVRGPFLAFIDDDEVPEQDWLLKLWEAMCEYNADAVLGPVRPYFETKPPKWIVKSRICDRPSHATGTHLHWRQTRTGNVLVRSSVFFEDELWFDPAFSAGGEDVDFFRRAQAAGRRFVWCEEAPAYELVPAARLTRSYHLKRALLQGSVSSKYSSDGSVIQRLRAVGKAMTAALLYTAALPICFLFGDHLGMKYLVKDCHHLARLLSMLNLFPSPKRTF